MAYREHQFRHDLGINREQEVCLIFPIVGRGHDNGTTSRIFFALRVMAGCEIVAIELFHFADQVIKFQIGVAVHAREGRLTL